MERSMEKAQNQGMETIQRYIDEIRPTDQAAYAACFAHWDSLCKPLRGLGVFEELVARIGAMQGSSRPHIGKRAVVIMGADNGVVAEGVSQTGSEVTRQVLENMGNLISSVCVMSRMLGAEVVPVNIGMNEDAVHLRVRNMAVRHGTGNIRVEDAMTREECTAAILTGIKVARELAGEGYDLLLAGEMGIGNTTTSSACAAALFGAAPETVTGRGAGLSSEGLLHKTEVIRDALKRSSPDPSDPLDILCKVGGLDIAGMTGVYLGAASVRVPVLIDGVISGISACLATMLAPRARDYMIATHATSEPAGVMIRDFLGLDPVLFAGMHLGEATGAAMFLPMLDQAFNLYANLASFADGSVEQYEHLI